MGKRSLIWNYFIKIDESEAKCSECDKVLKTNFFSTTALIRHLRSLHPRLYMDYERENTESLSLLINDPSDDDSDIENPQPSPSRGRGTPARKRPSSTPAGAPSPKVPKLGMRPQWPVDHFENVRLVTEVTRFVVESDQSFRIVDHPSFLRMMRQATKGQFNPVSARQVSRKYFPRLYAFMKKKVFTLINQDKPDMDGVGFTSDIWTSKTNASFQSLTLHYIDKHFAMKRFMLRLESFPESHTAENICSKLSVIIDSFEFGRNVFRWATTDGGAPVVKAVNICPEINTGLRCVDHTIHLIVTKALEKCKGWSIISKKVSRLVGHFSLSAKATAVLKRIAIAANCNRTTLVQRVVTRWNSDLRQLESVLDLYDSLQTMAENDTSLDEFLPSMGDKLVISALANVLQLFQCFSDLASSDKGPTLHVVIPELISISAKLNTLTRSPPNEIVGEVGWALKAELDARFPDCGVNTVEYAVAHFMDPRYKGVALKKYDKYNATRDLVVQGLLMLTHGDGSSPTGTPTPPLVIDEDEDDPMAAMLRESYGPNPTKRGPESTMMVEVNCEVDVYVKEPVVPRDSNVLEWWKTNRKKFPFMSRFARKILCVPAASSTSERVFSTAGNIISERRTNLNIGNIEMLVYMKENFRELDRLGVTDWPGFA